MCGCVCVCVCVCDPSSSCPVAGCTCLCNLGFSCFFLHTAHSVFKCMSLRLLDVYPCVYAHVRELEGLEIYGIYFDTRILIQYIKIHTYILEELGFSSGATGGLAQGLAQGPP